MLKLLKDKKGLNRNSLAVIIFLFSFGFITIMSFLVTSQMVDYIKADPSLPSEVGEVGDKFLDNMKLFDKGFFLIAVVLIIGVGITSYKLASPAVFFIISFITGALYGFISYFFNYIFQEMVGNTLFTATVLYFPLTILVCRNLHWVMLAMIIVGAITLYAKRGEQGQFLA